MLSILNSLYRNVVLYYVVKAGAMAYEVTNYGICMSKGRTG